MVVYAFVQKPKYINYKINSMINNNSNYVPVIMDGN